MKIILVIFIKICVLIVYCVYYFVFVFAFFQRYLELVLYWRSCYCQYRFELEYIGQLVECILKYKNDTYNDWFKVYL